MKPTDPHMDGSNAKDLAQAKIKIRIRVTLEPALEQQAALWTPLKRLRMARVYYRWARQLDVSAKILSDEQRATRRPQPKRLRHRDLLLN